ncbi:hypothetical protein BS78_02G392300 [Paspalum vaginatum]|nr:hypothetical protein BS78_02G392300 [Paspalum vaginatum]
MASFFFFYLSGSGFGTTTTTTRGARPVYRKGRGGRRRRSSAMGRGRACLAMGRARPGDAEQLLIGPDDAIANRHFLSSPCPSSLAHSSLSFCPLLLLTDRLPNRTMCIPLLSLHLHACMDGS